MRRRSRRRNPSKTQLLRAKYPTNEKVRSSTIRLVATEEGSEIVSRNEALRRASEQGMDLIQISQNKDTAICKIMEFSKFKYEMETNKQGIFRKQEAPKNKEVRIGPNIDDHDFEFKAEQAKKFLDKGHKVQVTMRFKGRQMKFKDLGQVKMLEFCVALEEDAKVENMPSMQGRQMKVMLSPKAS